MLTADDVHLAYGRAMHEIQRFEWTTIVGGGLSKVVDEVRSKDPSQKLGPLIMHVEEAIRKLSPRDRTLGSLFNRLYESPRKKSSAFDNILKKANDDRNRMAHYFLLTVDFKSSKERARAIADLSSVEERFRKRYEATKKVIGQALRIAGIAQSDVNHIYSLMDGLISNLEAEDFIRRGSLGRCGVRVGWDVCR